MNQFDLVVNQELRQNMVERIEVLEQVKEILTLGTTEFVTVELASQYYEVGKEAIQSLIKDNRDELAWDGLRVYRKSEIQNVLEGQLENFKIPNRGMALIPKRALLRIGMLLRDSEVAKNVRTRLLDIVHDAETQTNIVEEVVNEIRTEQHIREDLLQAIMDGDSNRMMVLQTELIGIKNKRIVQLEETIEEQQPKVEYHDEVLNSKRLMPITNIAKDLGMSAIKLNMILKNKGIIYSRGKCYVPYAEYQWLVPDYCDFKMNKYQQALYWTEKGRKWIIDLLEDMK